MGSHRYRNRPLIAIYRIRVTLHAKATPSYMVTETMQEVNLTRDYNNSEHFANIRSISNGIKTRPRSAKTQKTKSG